MVKRDKSSTSGWFRTSLRFYFQDKVRRIPSDSVIKMLRMEQVAGVLSSVLVEYNERPYL